MMKGSGILVFKSILERVAQVVVIAAVTTVFLNIAIKDMLKELPAPIVEVSNKPVVAAGAPVKAAETVEPYILTSTPKRPVYYGLCLTDELIAYTEALCAEKGLDPVLAMAVMFTESRGKWVDGDWDEELNRYRSVGYFQIRDVNWHWLKEEGFDVKTEEGNIQAGVHMLAELSEKYDGDMVAIVTAYKCGEYRGQQILDQNIILGCVKDVIDTYNHFWED